VRLQEFVLIPAGIVNIILYLSRKFKGQQRNFAGEYFWVRGYFVSTVGLDEDRVIEYIHHQEKADEQREQSVLECSCALGAYLSPLRA